MDRLSSLPESLIIGILSRVEFKDAVKTSVLSKQWRSAWTQLPTLKFKDTRRPELSESNSVEIVNRLIAVRRRYGVKTFSVELGYRKRFASDVNAWIEFAAACEVENLSVVLHAAEAADGLFRAPPSHEWPCLSRLSLGRVRFASQQHLENLLSRCPVLESLELDQCRGFYRLEIGNPSFRRLRVVNGDGDGDYLRVLSAAHMRELEVSSKTHLWVNDVSSVRQASIDVSDYESEEAGVDDFRRIGCRAVLLKLFRAIPHVYKLELCGNTIQVISEIAKYPGVEFPQFMRLQNLAICTANHHISGIVALLTSSPNLENLLISCLQTASVEEVEIEVGELDKWNELLKRPNSYTS